MSKNKKILIGVGVFLLVGVVVFFLWPKPKAQEAEQTESVLQENSEVKEVESSVTVAVVKSSDGKKAILTVENIPGRYEEIEYEFSYDTAKGSPRGVLGTVQPKNGSVSKEIVLGSCSTNVCVYDEGVKKVQVQLRFTTSGGEQRVFDKDFSL